jgi:hypothetical protein
MKTNFNINVSVIIQSNKNKILGESELQSVYRLRDSDF